ncbi:uncharacterized protein [Apostichopus japonicus]|uniref:uncharacterized protein n=1 Tax=Stichopus japonicus TaxID=307972 RepID=UPI003AB67DF0
MHSQFAIVLCILLMNGASSMGEDDLCASVQYVELSELGIIQCNFGSHYYGAFWYNTTEHRFEDPFLYFENSNKSGIGIESGEFNILPNGSLVINNVTLQHEHSFRVFMFLEEESGPTVQYDVNVKVVVKPEQDYPIIDKCEQNRRTCFLKANQIDLSCYVRDSRPAVALSWWKRTSTMEINILESYSVIRGEEWESSYANITYQFENTLPLVLVVCKAVQIPLLLPINESMVLLENYNYMIPSKGMYHSYVLHRGNISLSCGNLEPTYLLWKKKISSTHYKDLAYFIFGDTNSSRAFTDEFMVAPNGALVISDILVKHEGVHVCLYEKKMTIKTVAYNLTVYSLPVPPYLVVNGCTNDGRCTVNISSSGSLTCSVKKIRPYVTLQWRIVHEEERDSITFSNHLIENRLVDDVYDVTLTSNFRVQRTFRKNLTLECITTGQHSNFLHYQRGLTLVLLDTYESNDTVTSSASDESVHLDIGYHFGINLAATTVVVLLGIIIWTGNVFHTFEEYFVTYLLNY